MFWLFDSLLRRGLLAFVFGVSLAALGRGPAAQTAQPDGGVAAQIPIAIIKAERDRPLPISRLNAVPGDAGVRGAELAVKDNNTTGRFTKQSFSLKRYDLPKSGDAAALIEQIANEGTSLVLVDGSAERLIALADAARGKPLLLFNLGASDARLREEDCRANVIHIAPSRAMLTDALAQFLVLKKWTRWFLISGANQDDKAYADAVRNSAKKFGARIVAEKLYADSDATTRTDTGHTQVQQQMAVFTQISTEHDVIVVADESEIFGPFVAYRSWSPRPVAGTSGLVPMSWHAAHEQWGATQIQNRFFTLAGRVMTPLDFHGWLAARAVGEAATRTKSGAFGAIRDYLLGSDFGVAAFKGQKVSVRPWDLQLRQPIAVATTELPVSWSPQPGFLHQRSELDTLGIDAPESKCKLR
jgi:ABC transporter substrate binding protein (PQQ-dependent alcohol dehydrogenase system)